jgi:cobyrinic acid a,c-diamide synthase
VVFDPLRDARLPADIQGLMVGGGFPETFGAELSANHALLQDAYRQINAGLVTWAECGGLLWLCKGLDGQSMAGVIAASASMTPRLTLGYRHATINADCPIGAPGDQLRGHEFHYSSLDRSGEALTLTSRFASKSDGHAAANLIATYLHHHPGGDPSRVATFVSRCAATPAAG